MKEKLISLERIFESKDYFVQFRTDDGIKNKDLQRFYDDMTRI